MTAQELLDKESPADSKEASPTSGEEDKMVSPAGADELRSLYNQPSAKNSGSSKLGGKNKPKVKGRFSPQQKIIGLGSGILVAGIIGFILLLLPALRLESYLASINRRVFAATESAVAARMDHLAQRYMIVHIMNLDTCSKVRSPECRALYKNMGAATQLFYAWRDASMEQKLIKEFGLTFTSYTGRSDGVRFIIKSSTAGKTIKLTDDNLKRGEFFGGDRSFGKEMNIFLRKNTSWNQVLQRRSIRKYLVRKHGTKFWCFFACETKDNIDLKVRSAKMRLQLKLVERTVYPFSSKYGFIMDCLINNGDTSPGGACSAEKLRENVLDRNTQLTDKELAKLEEDLTKYIGTDNIKLSQVMLERLFAKILSDDLAAKELVSDIPVAGQIYLALTIVDMVDQGLQCINDNCLSKFAYDITSNQYLEFYTAMRSANDELKAGVLKADEAGALNDQFGGNQPAESSLVYQAYNGTTANKSIAAFLGTAYAAGTSNSSTYKCADGNPIPAGQLVCPEKKVARQYTVEKILNNPYVSGFTDIINKYRCMFNVPVLGCIGPDWVVDKFLHFINEVAAAITGPIAQALMSALQFIPGISYITDWMKAQMLNLIHLFMNQIFPLPVQVASPGREKYDGLEAGGETADAEFSKGGVTPDGQSYGLGGKVLTPAQHASILEAYLSQQNYDYSRSSYLTKLSSLDYPNSFASRFVASMPSSVSQLSHQFIAMLSSPFNGLLHLSHPASAATGTLLPESPFGITRFGYPADDPAFTTDPATLTDQYCADAKTAWQNSKTEDPLTGNDEYSVTDPCMLEQVVVETGMSALTGNDSLN